MCRRDRLASSILAIFVAASALVVIPARAVVCPELMFSGGTQTCTVVQGTLTVRQTSLYYLTDLASITSVGSLLIERNDNLVSLGGLQNLRSINGSIIIMLNNKLEHIRDLQGVNATLSGGLTIEENPVLESLDGLGGIRSVFNSVTISGNRRLTNISDLGGLSGPLFTSAIISSNPELTSLRGLEGLTTLGGTLYIAGCPRIKNLDGLQGIRTKSLTLNFNQDLEDFAGLNHELGGDFRWIQISGNPSLRSLNGLENITSTLGIEILNNSAIVSLDGLQGLTKATSLNINNNDALTSLKGVEALQFVDQLTILGNPSLQNISSLAGLRGNMTQLQIGGPDHIPSEEANQELKGFCELCHLDFFHSVEVYISIYNYLNASSPFSSVAEWEHAGKPCAPSLNCSSQALFPSATPSLSATVVPTPSVAPSPSHCPVNCSINLTAIADDIAAAGDDPEKLLVIAKKLLQATNQLDLSDNATRTLMNRLGGAIGRSFTNAMAATVADAMSSATILMQVAGSVLDGPVVSGFISGLGSGAGLMTGENDPEILAAVVGNGTALLAKISRQATDSQQGAQLVDAAELLALAHAKSGVSELVITNELAIGGQQGTIDVLAGVVFELLTSSITLPDDSQLTDLPGTFTLAPILWSNQSFPGNSLQNITAAVVLTVSLLSSDGTRQRVDNLDPPIRLAVPLSPGVRPQDVLCASFDHSRALWVPDGCELDLDASNATVAFCLCTHLTDFSVLVTTDGSPSESKGDGEAFPIGAIVGISVGGAAVLCACVLVSCFLIGAVLVLYRRRSKVFVITGTPTAFHNPESSF